MTEVAPLREVDAFARIRLTLDLSPRLNAVVERIAGNKGTTKADVLRAAIEYLEMAEAAANDGLNVGAWRDDKNKRLERVFNGL
jgi:hypothetical protein